MNKNSNNTNTDLEKSTYHHGNLRKVLVAEGLKVLNQKNSDDFSLREVARNIGVSATSVYRHFSSKQTFVDALCAEGSQMLATAQRKAMVSTGGGQEGLDATGLAYVHFAVNNAALFKLMCKASSSVPRYDDTENLAMKELLSNITALLPKGTTARQKQIRALHAWSVVHGIAMLVLEGRFANDDELIMAVIRTPGT